MTEMNTEIRVKFKIGEIEFEAEGKADLVERERSIFTNSLLPSAVEAIVRTRGVVEADQFFEPSEPTKYLIENKTTDKLNTTPVLDENDYSRMNLASYIKSQGDITEQEFTLFAAYFDEKKNGKKYFTKSDLERYYSDARRTVPSNPSMSLHQLAEKGLIMDAVDIEKKSPKPYIVSSDGIDYINKYQPKQDAEKKTAKTRKPYAKKKSMYNDINSNDLNLVNYPDVKSLKEFKEKMMIIIYIITKEGKGEWFTTNDVLCLMTDIFGESATKDQVNGVFKREKLWFKSEMTEGNEKEVKRKILNKGVEFVENLIENRN